MNILIALNAYEDKNASNSPTRNYFKWQTEISGAEASKPKSEELFLAPGESRTLFNGARTLSQDITTQYSISLKVNTSNTYVLKHVGGTAPIFRTARTTSADNTTVITVTQSATVTTFSSTAGTPLNLISGGAIVGDNVIIAGPFNISNKVQSKILSLTATSFSIENISGVPEVVTMASVNDIKIFSAAGVQKQDSLRIYGGFSPATRATYEITSVSSDEIEFYSSKALAAETVTTNQINAYYGNKNFVYLESDYSLNLEINGQSEGNIDPFVEGNASKPAIFMKKSVIWSMVVTNDTINTVKVFYVTIE